MTRVGRSLAALSLLVLALASFPGLSPARGQTAAPAGVRQEAAVLITPASTSIPASGPHITGALRWALTLEN